MGTEGRACEDRCSSRVIGHRKLVNGTWEEVCVCKVCGCETKANPRAPQDWFIIDHAAGRVVSCTECGLSFTETNPWSGHVLVMHCQRMHGRECTSE